MVRKFEPWCPFESKYGEVRDVCSYQLAKVLADELRQYWLNKGYSYNFIIYEATDAKRETPNKIWGIRSNLRFDGARQLPPVTHAEAAE